MKRLVSGIKPTGNIHIGNYFGAMRPMLDRQADYDSFLFIADLHALNQVNNAEDLHHDILEIAKSYLAVGIDPEKVTLFQQSAIPEVGTLSTVLAALTSLGLLERAHAYKDAVAKGKSINAGLFTYPVLMAADILLYKGEVVPVGQDQQQHLEMTREMAERFNRLYGETFTLPQPIHGVTQSVVGLDGRKMSKSYGNVISLFDNAETVTKKVMHIVTDSRGPSEPKDPDTCTIYQMYTLLTASEQQAELASRYRAGTVSYKEAKELLATELNRFLEPIRERKRALDADDAKVYALLTAGAEKARPVAQATLAEVLHAAGLS